MNYFQTYVCHQLPDVVMRLATGYSSGQRDSLKADVESGGPSQLDLIPVSGNYISHLQVHINHCEMLIISLKLNRPYIIRFLSCDASDA